MKRWISLLLVLVLTLEVLPLAALASEPTVPDETTLMIQIPDTELILEATIPTEEAAEPSVPETVSSEIPTEETETAATEPPTEAATVPTEETVPEETATEPVQIPTEDATVPTEETVPVETTPEEMLENDFLLSKDAMISGFCGEKLTYLLSSDGKLTISGTGPMYDYDDTLRSPWYDAANGYQEQIFELVISSGVTAIGAYAFSDCKNLIAVHIPVSVTKIGERSFYGCSSLKDVYYTGTSDSWSEIKVGSKNDPLTSASLHFAGTCGTSATWTLTPDGILTISGSGTIKNYTSSDDVPWYAYREDIQHIVIEEGITNIGNNAFKGCAALKSVQLAQTLTYIGFYAFEGCTSLESITIPSSITSIGDFAFSGCTNLKNITLSENLYRLARYAFSGCTSLEEITLPKSLDYFENHVFAGCTALRNVTLPEGMTGFGGYAFLNCKSVTSLVIPSTVAYMGRDCFDNCTDLASVFFLGSAPDFDSLTFGGADLLAFYPVEDPSWPEAIGSYGGTVQWIPYLPDSALISSLTESYSKEETDYILIRSQLAGGQIVDAITQKVKNVTISSSLGTSLSKEGTLRISRANAMQQDITLSKSGYQTYIIPAQAAATFRAEPTGSNMCLTYEHTAYMQLDQKDGKPYISTIFGRISGDEGPYQELRSHGLDIYNTSRVEIIVTAVGMEGKNPTYYIGQSGERRIASQTGIFTEANLAAIYDMFDYGQPIYAYAIAEDGTSAEPQRINLRKMADADEYLDAFLKNSKISLVGKGGQSIQIPQEIPLFGGAKFSLAAFSCPIGIDVQGSDVKISLGLNIFDSSQNNSTGKYTYSVFKNEISSCITRMQKGENVKNQYDQLRNKYLKGTGSGINTGSHCNFNISFLGYAEGQLVDNKIVFKDVLLSVNGTYTFRYTQQCAIWFVPAYAYVEASAGIGLSTNAVRMLPDKEVPLDFGLTLNINPGVKVGAGAGVKDAASIGLWAKGTMPYQNNFSEKYHTLKVVGEFGWEAEFFILKGSDTLLSGDVVLFENYYGKNRSYTLRAPALKGPETSGTIPAVSVSSRSYNASPWLGESPAVTPFAVAASGVSFRDLQQDVFDRSQPQIAALGDGLIMVWVEDNASRDTYNRMRLVYSVYDPDSDSWSQVQPVSDDGCNDAYPSLVSDGTNAYVAWQKIDRKLTAKDCTGLDVLLENSEVYLSKFDSASGRFGTAKKLTDNALYEYAPTVVLENGEPAVYYASASGKDLNTAGKTTLYRQTMTGTASAVAASLNYILGIDAANGQVSYVMDADGDTSTTNDINAYTISGGASTAFDKGGNDVGYTYAAYADLNGRNTLFVSDMGNIYYVENGETRYIFPTDRSIAGNLSITNTSAGTAILWTETEEGWNELYAVSYEDGGWTEPVKISDQNALLSAVDITALNGKLAGVCNTTAMTYDYAEGYYREGKTDLSFFLVNDFTDLAISDYFYIDETAIIPGQDYSFDVLLTNKGTTTANSIQFTVTDTLGTQHTVTKELNLLPGVTDSVTVNYPVPANYSFTTLSVTAAIPGVQDIDTENNTASAVIGKPDLSVTETAVHIFEDGYILKAAVENGSAVTAEGITLDVILDDKENAPIHTQDIGTLDRYRYASVDIALGLDKLNFDENGVAKVYLRTQCSTEDAADADNITCVLITEPKTSDCGHSATETVARKEPTCTQPGHTSYERCISCGEAVSGYSEIPAGHSYESVVTQPTCTEGGKTTHTCSVCGSSYTSSETAATGHNWQEATCTEPKTCKTCKAAEGSPLGHTYENGSCIRCGEADPDYSEVAALTRIAGDGRCQTAMEAAEELKKIQGVEKFQTILVADGNNYPDALSGSYLAAVTNAPILLVQANQKKVTQTVIDYIVSNLTGDGTVYILGGPNSIPADFENSIRSSGFTVKRLAGNDRYLTSLMIIQEGDALLAQQGKAPADSLLVCAGGGYADSLSASATGRPVLLVNGGKTSLTTSQKNYLDSIGKRNIFIIGGPNSVSDAIATQLNAYDTDGATKRIAGNGREETSAAVAYEFFPNADFAVLADGNNYPDGLSGGPVAYAKKAPLLLIRQNREASARDYVGTRIKNGYILGGINSVSDASVKTIFGADCLIK